MGAIAVTRHRGGKGHGKRNGPIPGRKEIKMTTTKKEVLSKVQPLPAAIRKMRFSLSVLRH